MKVFFVNNYKRLYCIIKQVLTATCCLLFCIAAFSQDAANYYERGLKENQARHYKKAVQLFDKAAVLAPRDNKILISRGLAKLHLKENSAAITDFTDAINIDSADKEAWCYRGVAKSYIPDYKGALADLNKAIILDADYGIAHYARGVVNENLGDKEAACADYNKAQQFGKFSIQAKVDSCNGTSSPISTKLNTVLLEGDNKQMLNASFVKHIVKDEDSSCLMLFALPQPEIKEPVTDSLDGITIEDSLSFVEISLENGGQIVVKNLTRTQASFNKQMIALIFTVIFNRQQKELLAKHNVEKIVFMYGTEQLEYKIKNKYTGNIRKLLSLPMPAQD